MKKNDEKLPEKQRKNTGRKGMNIFLDVLTVIAALRFFFTGK